MSNYQDPQWDPYRQQDPYHKGPRRTGGGGALLAVLLLGGLGSICLIAFVAGVIFIAGEEGQWQPPQYTGDHESFDPAQPQDWAAVKAAYDRDRSEYNADTIARMQRLIDEFARCSNEDDHMGLRRVVDYARFFREVKNTRFDSDVALFDQSLLKQHLIENVRGIKGWERIEVVAVVDAGQRGEKIVYAHGFHDDNYTNPVRFWVADGRQPKCFDWEMLEFGVRETGDWAISCAYQEDPRRDAHWDADEEVVRAEVLYDDGNEEEAHRILNSVVNTRVPPPLHDEFLVNVAYTWLYMQQPEQVHAICGRLKDRKGAPGSIFIVAQAFEQEEKYEQALAEVERYEAIMGRTPESLDTKIRICEALERDEEVEKYIAEKVKILPDNPIALDAWARQLTKDEQDQLAAHLASLPNTGEVASAMAARMSYDAKTTKTLAAIIQQHDPKSASADFLRAVSLQDEREFERAAPLYKKVIERTEDETQLSSAQYRYMHCMIELDQALQAYNTAKDPQFVYDYLLEDYEYDGPLIPHEQYVQIVDAHLKRFPNDPWNYYYASLVKEEDVPTEQIEKLLRDGLSKAANSDDEWVEDSLNDRLITVMFHAGKWREAYRSIPPADETFRQLANQFRFDESDESSDELVKLIEEHAKSHAIDPWIPFYKAVVYQKVDQIDKGEKVLAEAWSTPAVHDDEDLAQSYRYLWLQLLTAQERYLDAYQKVTPQQDAFEFLARHLSNEKNWEPLEQLLSLQKLRVPNDGQQLYWRVGMFWEREKYTELAQAMAAGEVAMESLQSWELRYLRLMHLRSLLRTDQLGAARSLAQQALDDEGDQYPMILVHVTAGEAEQASALIREYAKTAYSTSGLYNDEDVGELLSGADYAAVRRAAPPTLPTGYTSSSGLLLLDQSADLTQEQMQQLAEKFLTGIITVAEVPNEEQNPPDRSFIMSDETHRIAVTYGSDIYQADADLRGEGVTDKSLRELYYQHKGWISIDILSTDKEDSEAQRMVQRMAASLMDEHTLLVNVAPGWLLPGTAVIHGDQASDIDETKVANFDIWLYREAESTDAEEQWQRHREQYMERLNNWFAQKTDSQQFHMLVPMHAGDARERPWLKLVRIETNEYDEYSFVVELEEPLLLFPDMKPGEYFVVEAYQVMNWKLTDGEQINYAQQPELN